MIGRSHMRKFLGYLFKDIITVITLFINEYEF